MAIAHGARAAGPGFAESILAAVGHVAIAAVLLLPSASLAQSGQVTRLTGSLGTGAMPVGLYELDATFTCDYASGPAGPCSGRVEAKERDEVCNNAFAHGFGMVITGLDLSRTGPFQALLTVTDVQDYDVTPRPDGSCTYTFGPEPVQSIEITGTWDGTTGTIALPPDTDSRGNTIHISGAFKAESTPPPVFPMVVSGSITPTVANIRADIQYRPQDVGTTGSVYVFAVAPADLVKAAADGAAPFAIGKAIAAGGAKEDSVACVLAQLNASGQLQAVSASSLQAYVTGVLSAQGQAVTILNGVATVNIGGATFYVGYGTSATAMINGGINRSAITVPGNRECRPQAPQKGWWWNAQESGRGFTIETSGNTLFMAAYLYDISGRATWHIAAGPTSIDGSVFNGQLWSFANGVTLGGAYKPNARLPDAGPVTLTFDDAQHGTLVWPGGTVAIERFAFGASGTATPPLANQPESGWWWNAAEDGRGYFIEWQGNIAFMAGYMYDDAGNAIWYTSDAVVTNPGIFQGSWQQFANGQTMTGPYRAPSIVSLGVAPVTLQFQGADTAILTLPGKQLPLTRFRF